jgi:hypothetical protein
LNAINNESPFNKNCLAIIHLHIQIVIIL